MKKEKSSNWGGHRKGAGRKETLPVPKNNEVRKTHCIYCTEREMFFLKDMLRLLRGQRGSSEYESRVTLKILLDTERRSCYDYVSENQDEGIKKKQDDNILNNQNESVLNKQDESMEQNQDNVKNNDLSISNQNENIISNQDKNDYVLKNQSKSYVPRPFVPN